MSPKFFTCITIWVLSTKAFAQQENTFSGSADFFTSYNINNIGGAGTSDFYSTASARQEVNIFGLPFEAGLQLSSYRGFPSYLPNVFSFGFNSQQFREKMLQRLNNRLETANIKTLSGLAERNALLKEKSQLDEIFNHPSVASDLDKLNRADSLRKIIAGDISMPDTALAVSNAKKLLAELEEVESRRELYENLKERKKLSAQRFNMTDTTISEVETRPGLVSTVMNPVALSKELKDKGLVNGLEKLALWVDRFEVGRIRVNWSDFTLRGITLDGADISVSPGGIQAGIVSGWIHPLFDYGYINDPALSGTAKRSVIGASVGYGSKHNRKVKVTILQFNDRTQPTDNLFSLHARKNHVISIGFSSEFLSDKLLIKGEASGSQTEFDKDLEQQPLYIGPVLVPSPDPPEKWLRNIFSGDQGSMLYSTGYAMNLELQLQRLLPGFNFNISSKYISPFYQSFGTPYLPSDMLGFEATAEKYFYKNRIMGFATWSRFSDNLESLKPYSTDWSRYVAGMRINFPDRPSFSFGYQPIIQNIRLGRTVFINSVFAQCVYSFFKNRNKNNFLLNYTFFSNSSQYLREFSTHNIIGSYFYQSPHRFGLTSLISYYNSHFTVSEAEQSSQSATDRYMLQFLPNYTFFSKWKNALGFQLRGSGLSQVSGGVLMESSVKAGSFLTFSIRAQYDNNTAAFFYEGDVTSQKQNRFFITTNLIANW